MTVGIYKLTFDNTDKVYIGLSENIERRFISHKYCFKHGYNNKKLMEAYNIHGLPIMEILEECPIDKLEERERYYIEKYNSIDNGYNIKNGGSMGAGTGVSGESNGRAKHTKETYVGIFLDLVYESSSYKNIALKWGTSEQVVDHIAAGVSHADWLKKEFPTEYTLLLNKVGKRNNKILEILDTSNNTSLQFSSLIEASEALNIPKSTISAFSLGKLSSLAEGRYVLKNKVTYVASKKPVYTLKCNITGYIFDINNIYKFCEDYEILNKRKAVTKFLHSRVIGSTFDSWELLGVS